MVQPFQSVSKGLYVAQKFDDETVERLVKLTEDLDIPNALEPHDFHTTILYSDRWVPYVLERKEVRLNDSGRGRVTTWVNHKGVKIAVLTFESEYLQERHDYGRALGATHGFDTFDPHVTLSYDCGPLEFDQEVEIDLVGKKEYSEVLDTE